MIDIKTKDVKSIYTICIEGNGTIKEFDADVDRLYGYIYKNKLENNIKSPLIGLFYTEHGGKYIAAIPFKQNVSSFLPSNISYQTLPGLKCAYLIHKGDWKSIEDSFNALKNYYKENNLPWSFPVREIYLRVDGKKENYLTEIQIPIILP